MLAQRAASLEKRAKAQNLFGIFPWMEILQILLPLIGTCGKKPVNPTPPNPTPNPTPAQTAAWEKAWQIKSTATDNFNGSEYSPLTIKRTATPIRKAKRRDGNPIKKAESHSAAVMALDEARAAQLVDVYHDVLEADHAM